MRGRTLPGGERTDMTFGGLIEMAVGLALVYLLLSVLTSGINEAIESILRQRSRFLEDGVTELLGETAGHFWNHPLIQALRNERAGSERRVASAARQPQDSKKAPTARTARKAEKVAQAIERKRMPSYVPSRAFSSTLLSLLTDGSTRLREGIPAAEPQAEPGEMTVSVESSLGFPSGQFHVRIGDDQLEVVGMQGTTWRMRPRADAAVGAYPAGTSVVRVRDAVPPAKHVLEEVQHNLARLPDGQLKRSVTAILLSSGQNLDAFRAGLEQWYDDKMDRVSGWYKRHTRHMLLVCGLGVALLFNADSIILARTLYTSSALRTTLAAAAQNQVRAGAPPSSGGAALAGPGTPSDPPQCPTSPHTPGDKGDLGPLSGSLQCVADEVAAIHALDLPLGWASGGPAWPRGPKTPVDFLLKALGLLITAAALTLGAPFWFDLLNKFVNARSTGQPPPKQGEPSRATQPPPGVAEAVSGTGA